MYQNRASYQSHNPHLSTKQVVKAKQPCLAFKSPDGVIFRPLDKKGVRLVARESPGMMASEVLLDLVNGQTLNVRHCQVTYQVTLVYR